MAFENLLTTKKAFVLGLDDVLYPEKDYLLQVYYLFSEFMAYSEQVDAKEILAFMKVAYEKEGAINLFDKTAEAFNLPEKYRTNFALLHQNARLPLKLLLYKQLLALLQEIVVERKTIFLLVDGDPAEQLNKIKQVERRCIETKPDVGRRCVYTQSLLHLTALVGLDRGVIMAELLLVEQVVEGRGVVIAPVNPDV